ncbi:MAG: hypothetical protein WCC60_17150, partial [Ilumatobacteraceae bacterium]
LLLSALLGVLSLSALAGEPATPASPMNAPASTSVTTHPPAPANVALPYGSGYEQRLRAAATALLESTPQTLTDAPRDGGPSSGTGGHGRSSGGSGNGNGNGGGGNGDGGTGDGGNGGGGDDSGKHHG